jgi:polyhydroxyalkanoate synthase
MPPSFGMPQGQGLNFDPTQLQNLQQQYLKEATDLWQQALSAQTPTVGDRRFTGEAWKHNPVASFAAATYLLNTRTLMSMAEAVQGDEKTKAR